MLLVAVSAYHDSPTPNPAEPPVDAVETIACIRSTSSTAFVVVVESIICNFAEAEVLPIPTLPAIIIPLAGAAADR